MLGSGGERGAEHKAEEARGRMLGDFCFNKPSTLAVPGLRSEELVLGWGGGNAQTRPQVSALMLPLFGLCLD